MSANSEFISPSSDFFPHETGKCYYRDDIKSHKLCKTLSVLWQG